MKRRKVRHGAVRLNNKLYASDFLEVVSEVLVEEVSSKMVNIYKINGKIIGQAKLQESIQQESDPNMFGMFHRLENVKTGDLIKELSKRPGTTVIKNRDDQQMKVTAGEKSRIKEKCEATILIVRSV